MNEKQHQEPNWWHVFISGFAGFIIGWYLSIKYAVKPDPWANYDTSLVIFPIDSDLGVTPESFNVLATSADEAAAGISARYVLFATLICPSLRFLSYVNNDIERFRSLNPDSDGQLNLIFGSGGFKRFSTYLHFGNGFKDSIGAEGAIKYATNDGLIFTQNFTSIAPVVEAPQNAFARYKRGVTMMDRMKDQFCYYSMMRGLFASTLMTNWLSSNALTGASLATLKNCEIDFRNAIAMSEQERTVINGIIAQGVAISVNHLTGEYKIVCNITDDQLVALIYS